MATEADVPEPVSSTQRVGENICLASGLPDIAVHETSPGELKKFQETLNLPCETAKCLAEPQNMQEAHSAGAETMNSVIKGNVETHDDESFSESPSAAVVASEETCTVLKHCQADEESFPENKEMLENERQVQNDTTDRIAQETGSKENKVVEESEGKAETNDRSNDIVHLTGTSLKASKIEELNLGIRGEGSLEDESDVDQHVEVIEDQRVSAEDKSTNKAESIKAKFTGEAIGKTSSEVDDKEAEKSTNLVGEEESSEATRLSERVENEKDEKEKSVNYSTGDILASNLSTYPDVQSDEESRSIVRDSNKELLYKPSVTLAGEESSVYEAGPETGEKLKEVSSISSEEENNNKIESSEKKEQIVQVEDQMNHKNNTDSSFAVQTEETSLQKLENPELLKVVPRSWSDDIIKETPEEVIEKIEKTAEGDIISNEKGEDYKNPEQEEESSFMKHEGTSSIIEVLAATDVSSSSGENRDEGGSTVVVTEDNTNDTKITDGLEHNHSGKSNCEERPDNLQQNEPEAEKLDASLSTVAQDFSIATSTKSFETIASDDKDAPIESCEESVVERSIDASQQSQSRTSNDEQRPEQLRQNEPEKEKLDGSSGLVNADSGSTASTEYVEIIPCAQEEAPIKSHEESFAEKIEEEIQIHSEPIIEAGISNDKNVPAIELNEKIDDSEVDVPNNDAKDVQVTYPSIEAVQMESKNLDIISNFEPKGQTHEAHKTSTEQKHIDDAPEACQSSNCTISEHTATERVTSTPISTSGIDVTNLQEACGLDSEENLMIKDSGESNYQEMKTNQEACHTVTHEILAKGDDAGKDIIDAEASVVANRDFLVTDEIVDQKFHIESPLPAAPTLTGEDETYNPEDNAKTNNITNQQVHDGTNTAGSGDATNEQVTESSVTYNSLESTEQETVESPQFITKEAEKSEVQNNSEQIIEDDNTGGLVPILVEQDSVNNLNDEKKKAEKSKEEVNWTVNQTPTEDSPEENRDEDISSHPNELLNAKDKIEKKPLESEEDLHNFLQKKKSREKIGESLPVVSDDTQIFSSIADKIPCLIKEGTTPVEETAKKEEKVNETEEKNEKEDNKTTSEEDFKLVAETSEASTESIVLEPKSARDIMVVENDAKKGESEEDLKLVAEKSKASAESIVLEPKSKRDVMVVEDKTKKGESEEDLELVAKTSEASIESIVLEPKSARDIMMVENEAKKGESKEDLKLVAEKSEASTESIVLEPKSKKDVMVVEDETKKGESEEDLKLVAEKSEASAESIVLEPKSKKDVMVVEDDAKKRESEEDLKLVAEKSEASTESIVLEPKSKGDVMMVEDDTKTGESEEDLELVAKTSEASIESIVLEPKSARDIMVVEDDAKKGESEEDLKLIAEKSEASTESIVLEPKSARDLMVVEDDAKKGESEEDLLLTETSEASIESIVLKPKSKKDKIAVEDDARNGESKEDLKLVAKTFKASTESIILEPKLERDIVVVEDDKKKGEFDEDHKLVAETSEASIESIVLEPKLERDIMVVEDDTKNGESKEDLQLVAETSKVSIVLEPKSEKDIVVIEDDTKKGEFEQDLKLVVDSSEASTESIILEPKSERDIMVVEDDTKRGEFEENLKLVVETSEASTESIVLKPKSERDIMVVEDGTKKGESEELYEDSKTDGEGEDTEKQITIEECVTTNISPEPVEEKSLISIKEEQNEEDRPKTEVDAEPDLTGACENAERQLMEEENTVDQCKELEVKNHVQSSEEDDTAAKMSKQDNDPYISQELIEQETVESSQGNIDKAEMSDAKNIREQIIDEGFIPESIEKDPTQNINDEKQKRQKFTREILENSEAAKAVESIAHETSKATEIPEEILDTSPVKQEENSLTEGKTTEASLEEEKYEEISSIVVAEENTNALVDAKEDTVKNTLKNEADLEHILQKNEPGEKLEQSLSLMSDGTETFSPTADKSPCLIVEGASEKLEETAQTEEKTEETNEARHDKIATEEDQKVVSRTSAASRSIESIVLEPNSEMDKIVVEDTRKGECEEVHVESETTSIGEDTEKQVMTQESIVEECRVLEVEKIAKPSEEDDKIANMYELEQETGESSKCITNNAEESEAENNKECAINSNIRDLIPESVEQDPVKNLNDEKMKAEKSSGEDFEVSKTAGATETIAIETIETLDTVDTSPQDRRNNLQNEGDNLTPIEASPVEKGEDRSLVAETQENTSLNEPFDAKENIEKNPSKNEEDLKHISQKNEPGEKLDQSLLKEEDETEAFCSNSDKIPHLMEEGASQNEEDARNEELEQNNETNDNKIAAEEDLKLVAETSDASKNKESIALETKSEINKMVDGDDVKNREYEELSEDTKDTSKGEDTEEQSLAETCHNTSIPEPDGENAPQNFAEEKEEETPKIEIFVNSETTRAVEGVGHETSDTTESPKELHDTSLLKQEKNLLSERQTIEASLEEGKNEDIPPVMVADKKISANELVNAKDGTENGSSKSEEDLEHILEKDEPEENLEQSLPMTSDEIEILSSHADKSPCTMVEAASQNLEGTAQIEDKTEESNEAKQSIIVTEEDPKVVVKTSEASKSIESTLFEHESKLDKMVVEDDMKKAESEEVHVEPDTTSIGEDTEKHITMEENTVEQFRVLEVEKTEPNSEEDNKIAKMSEQGNITYISRESIEQETVESSQGNSNTTENSEAGNNNEYTMEDGNISGLIPEPVEQDPVKNLNDEKIKAEKSSGEVFEISKTAEAAESNAHETIQGDNKRDNSQSEGDNLTPKEASLEEKDEDRSPVMVALDNSCINELLDAKDNIDKNSSKTEENLEHISQKDETGEKRDQLLSRMEDETEAFSSNADKTPQLMEEGGTQNEEAARNEEETEQNNEIKDNKIEMEEDLKVFAETSDPSKSKESIALEPKSETDKIVDGEDIKNGDSEQLSEDSKDTVKSEDTEKQNIEEACHITSILQEHIGEQVVQSSAEEETPKIEGCEITQTVDESENTGKQNIEEGSVAESNIEVLVQETDEEDSLKNENKNKEHEEEVDDSKAISSDKETDSETMKDRAESIMSFHHLDVIKASEEEKHPKEIKEDLVEKSVSLSKACYEDSKEEMTSKEETKFDCPDSVSVTQVKEEAGLQETEAEVETFGLVSEEKGIAETETRETMLESGDMKVTPEDTSNLSEMMDKDNTEVANEDKIDKEEQNEVPHAVNEDQDEVATNVTPLKETLGDELKKYSTTASEECKLKSSEASESVDETPENIQAPDENEGTTFVAQEIDEMLVQTHDTTNPLSVSAMRSIDTEKETANEAQKHKVDDFYVHPELENEKDLSISEDVKILMREQTGELTDQSDICTSKTLQDVESSDLGLKMEETTDGKPSDEASKFTKSSSVCTEIEKAIIEQEISEGNLHEGVKVEKAAIEQKEEAPSKEHKDTSTKNDGTLNEMNFESVDPDQMFEVASVPVAKDQHKQKLPESDESKIEENNNNKKQQDEKEIKEAEEPTLEAEENKEQNPNEITKAVLSTEKAPYGVEQLDDIEDIKEAAIEKELVRNELHALSTVGETNQVKDSTLVCSDAIVAESKEKAGTEILEVEEDSTRQREASFGRQSEEQNLQDVSTETPAEELEEKKNKKILEESEDYCSKNNNATMATVTAEKSSQQTEQVDKLMKASNIDPEPYPEKIETENSHQNKEIDIMKLEETSCGLTSNLPTFHDSHAEQESNTVENTEESECEETKIASEAFYETKDQGTEENDIGTTVEKKDQAPSYGHDHAEKENATLKILDKNEVEETKITSAADQSAEGTLEFGKRPTVERMDQDRSSNPEQEEKQSMAVENSKVNEVNESKVSSDAIYMSQHQSTEDSAGKTSMVEIPELIPISNSEHAQNESVTEENPEADETNRASDVEKQDAYQIEEVSKVASDYRAHRGESVREDETTVDQTVSTEKLEEKLPALTSATTTRIEKIEEEKTKEVDMLEGRGPEDSSVADTTEDICLQKEVSREVDFSARGLKLNKDVQECAIGVHEKEGSNPGAALQLEPQENNNKIEHGDSSSEIKNTTDLTGQIETGSDLKLETSEKTLESEMVMHNHGITESEDTKIKEKHLVAVNTEMRAGEKQLQQTSETNDVSQNEVSNGKITEEKEAAKTHDPVSLFEKTINVSLQEDELKAEESIEEKTHTININSVNTIKNEELSVSTASKNIEEPVPTDDRSVQDPEQVSVVNETIQESFPNDFEEQDTKDAAIKLASINQGEETNFASGKTETTTPRDEEMGIEISQKESIRGSVNGSDRIQDIQELDNSCATMEKKVPTEADLIESPNTIVSTGNEYIPSVLQEGITEVRDFEPGNYKEVHLETKGTKLEGEKIAGDSEEETIKEPVKMDTDTTMLSALLQTSRPQVAEHVTKDRELTASPEKKTEEAENVIGEEKDDKEEGDEHKKTDLSSDSPVVVDVTRDMDVKVSHKKSHGILSGVGSKVKHSISKVKKAITGKSSHHPKPASPK